LLDRKSVQDISSELRSDRYTKKLTTYCHLQTLLFGVMTSSVSLREITLKMLSEAAKLPHLGINFKVSRSTLADANKRRSSEVFGRIYSSLYGSFKRFLSDSRRFKTKSRRVFALDSTTITLFSEILGGTCKPNGRSGRRKGGIKAHAVINVEEGVPCLVRFSKAARSDSKYMHLARELPKGSFVAMDRGYGDHGEYEKMTEAGIWYITRLKDNVSYAVEAVRTRPGAAKGGVRKDEVVTLSLPGSEERHRARRIEYTGKTVSKGKEIDKDFVFLTNNLEMSAATVARIYRSRWQIELLFKKIKQYFPLKYFYGDSENAVKTQIWAVMIACLLLTVVHRKACSAAKRKWAFSNMLAAIRSLIMSYVDIYVFLENPEKNWESIMKRQQAPPNEPDLFSLAKPK
jgi:hypothetical protein